MLWSAVVVAKESDVTELMIHTESEMESKYKETRHATLETGGRESAKKKGWASWTAQAFFAWTRTHEEPRRSGTCGYIDAGLLRAALISLLCAALTCPIRASGLLAPRHRMATVACSMPAAVYSHVVRKRKFSTLSLRSAVENGSFSPLARPLQHEHTLFNCGDANSQ